MVGYVARMGARRGSHRVLVGKPEGRRPLGTPRQDGRIIIKGIFSKWDGRSWTGLIWLKMWTGGGVL